MTEQTKAQRLADEFDNGDPIAHTNQWKEEAAAELRRIDALVCELVEALGEAHDLCLDAYCSQAREVIVHALDKSKEQT